MASAEHHVPQFIPASDTLRATKLWAESREFVAARPEGTSALNALDEFVETVKGRRGAIDLRLYLDALKTTLWNRDVEKRTIEAVRAQTEKDWKRYWRHDSARKASPRLRRADMTEDDRIIFEFACRNGISVKEAMSYIILIARCFCRRFKVLGESGIKDMGYGWLTTYRRDERLSSGRFKSPGARLARQDGRDVILLQAKRSNQTYRIPLPPHGAVRFQSADTQYYCVPKEVRGQYLKREPPFPDFHSKVWYVVRHIPGVGEAYDRNGEFLGLVEWPDDASAREALVAHRVLAQSKRVKVKRSD